MKTKSFLLTFIFVCCLPNIYAKTVIVIFTSTSSESKGVWNFTINRSSEDYDDPRVFTLFDRAKGNNKESYLYRFVYTRRSTSACDYPQYLDQSMLDAYELIDWDKVTSKSEAEAKYKQIISSDTIYFIDRNDSSSSPYKAYNVKLFKFNY